MIPLEVAAYIERTGHRRYLDWWAMGGQYRATLIRLARGEPPAAATPLSTADASAPPPNPHMARIEAARRCPRRIDPRGCGCSDEATCLEGIGWLDGGRTAPLRQCLECPRGGGSVAVSTQAPPAGGATRPT